MEKEKEEELKPGDRKTLLVTSIHRGTGWFGHSDLLNFDLDTYNDPPYDYVQADSITDEGLVVLEFVKYSKVVTLPTNYRLWKVVSGDVGESPL